MFFIGIAVGGVFVYVMNEIIFNKIFSGPAFAVAQTVYWRCVEEVGDTNSQWTVTLKKGTVVSSDVRVCIEEDNEGKTLVFIEKEKLYTAIHKLKRSIGAELTLKEQINEEGRTYYIL